VVIGEAYSPNTGTVTRPLLKSRTPRDCKFALVKVAEIGVVDDPDFGIIEKDTEVKELTATS